MPARLLELIDFEKVDSLLEGFNKTTGFVTAILDLDGKVLSKSGWRPICTEFHRVNPETAKKCTISDTVLAGKMEAGEKYHFYQCLNGLVDVAVPIVIKGIHIANLFSGQFFFEEPDNEFFKEQAEKHGFNQEVYLKALKKVPVVSKEKVLAAMDFLLDMTQLISEMTFQKLEQIELNEAIRESETKFKSVFESANVGKSITLPSGEINANEAFCKMLGYSQEELKNKKWQEITPEDEIPFVESKLKPLINDETDSTRFEKRYLCKDGSPIWTDVSVSIRRDNQGKPLHFITTIADITERKLTENALNESEKLLRLSTELANVAAWEYDFTTNSMSRSKNHDNLYGLEVQKHWAFETFLNATHPDDREMSNAFIQKSVAPGGPDKYRFDFRVVYPDQSIHWLNVIGEVVGRNEKGEGILVRGFLIDITDRKQAEEAQKETAANLKSLIDNREDSIWSLDRNFRYLIFNSTYEQIFNGVNKVELKKGLDATQFLSPEAAEFWIPKYNSVFEGESMTFEFSFEFKTGIRYFQTSLNPIIESNVITGASAISREITDRKQAEEQLRLSEEKFSSAYHVSPVGLTITRIADGKFLEVNESFLRIYEFTREEVIGHTSTEINILSPEARAILIKAQVEAGGLQNAEMLTYSKSGKAVDLFFSSKPITIDGEACYVSTMIDITDRKRAEKLLIESERRFRDTLENVHLISAQINFSGEVIYCNPYLCELTGYTREEIVGNDWFSKFVPDIRPDVKEMFLKAIESGEIESLYENPIRKKDGTERIIRFSNTVLLDSEGKVIGTTSIGEDITEQKLAEEEIRTLNQTLEHRVIERTAQLEAANKELETFTYSVSHDLKAPLRGIDGYGKLLLELHGKDLNEEAKTFLNTIRSSTMQMNQLIDDLLEYSRLERSSVGRERIKIKDLVGAITSIYKNELNAGNYSLKFDVQDIELVADLKGLTIALRNILENAIKFTKGKAHPAIEIGFEEKVDSWIISVKDNGIGFDIKYHQRIFEIFQRLQRAEDFQGTGVGLALVSKAMQRMGGKTWAESAPGMGATFYLEIPK